jgi:hypothetical protein
MDSDSHSHGHGLNPATLFKALDKNGDGKVTESGKKNNFLTECFTCLLNFHHVIKRFCTSG